MLKEVIKPPFLWGVVLGAFTLLIIIFWTGWVVTASAAVSKGKFMAKEAVLESLVPICVDQFNNDPMKVQRMTELENVSSYQQDDLIDEFGWSTMPGSEKPVRGVADLCAVKISEMKK
jgi:hypothetical protein